MVLIRIDFPGAQHSHPSPYYYFVNGLGWVDRSYRPTEFYWSELGDTLRQDDDDSRNDNQKPTKSFIIGHESCNHIPESGFNNILCKCQRLLFASLDVLF